MKKISRLPHEQAAPRGGAGVGPEQDGLPADGDVEGHRQQIVPGMPGTGGDQLRDRSSGGEDLRPRSPRGELDAGDVEGHLMGHTKGERLSPGMPGTGGDRIAVDVDDDDTEGHRQS